MIEAHQHFHLDIADGFRDLSNKIEKQNWQMIDKKQLLRIGLKHFLNLFKPQCSALINESISVVE